MHLTLYFKERLVDIIRSPEELDASVQDQEMIELRFLSEDL
jgi:hypothetical protein